MPSLLKYRYLIHSKPVDLLKNKLIQVCLIISFLVYLSVLPGCKAACTCEGEDCDSVENQTCTVEIIKDDTDDTENP